MANKIDDVMISREALDIITNEQLKALKRLIGERHKIKVRTPWMGSPDGWIEFVLIYNTGDSLYGGISAEGVVNT